jgi:para-nitrobenzyl esterase
MTIVATRSGKVEGFEDRGIQVFKGIPYASPPVGKLRWRRPQPEPAWDGVRDATKFSAQCAQSPFAMTQMMGGEPPVVSEDSLYLNVWTPACDDAKRPVMFWIHGGAFIWGAGDTPWYDGTKFAQHGDVVVVTINYRLGPFGFLHLADLYPELEGTGNLGILDQIAALEWTRDCIAAFGGDPERVTIFGESAGGASVGTLLGTPAARGLFTQAIAQSGAVSWTKTRDAATEIASQVVASLGVAPGDLDALLGTSMQEVIDAIPAFTENGSSGLPFGPVHDGTVLPVPPLDAIRAGSAEGVRVITGTNKDEMTLFVLADPNFFTLDFDQVRERAIAAVGADGSELFDRFRALYPDVPAPQLWVTIATEVVFHDPAIRMLEAQEGHGDTWSYLFTWETPAFGGMLKSTHALEIPFVWDNLDQGAEMFTGDGGERQGIADAMHAAWIAFARTGDPSTAALPWPQYDTKRRATVRFDETCEVLDDPGRELRLAFESIQSRSGRP